MYIYTRPLLAVGETLISYNKVTIESYAVKTIHENYVSHYFEVIPALDITISK